MEELWLAYEGGGTKTRMLLARPGGEILASETGTCSNYYYIEPEAYLREMGLLLEKLRHHANGIGGRVVVAGLAGPMNHTLVREMVSNVFGPVEVVESGEAEIALAFHGLQLGLALIAGTGSNCTACNEAGERLGTGGFGPQFDDAGSAYWIGREAVIAVVRARDGRGPDTALEERLFAYAGIGRLWDLLKRCDRNGHVPRQFIAGFAPRVFEAAREGDAVARVVCRAAGVELGQLVAAAAKRGGIRRRPIPLVPSGGVFHGADLILPAVEEIVRELDLEIYPVVLEPAPGILRIIRVRREGRDARVS